MEIVYGTIAKAVSGIFDSAFSYFGVVKKADADKIILGREGIMDYAKGNQIKSTLIICLIIISVIVFVIVDKKRA